LTKISFGALNRVPAYFLTRRAAMRGIGGGALATAFMGVGGAFQARAGLGDAATPVATPGVSTTLTDATLRDFTAYVEAAMQTFHQPGAAVALVQRNEIVFNHGFGVRNLESGEPVTPRTRFRIGSITKSMTALLLGTLVDEACSAGTIAPSTSGWPSRRRRRS
jgi:CubicO group peptidase (beta-lactamase class C family)